MKLAPTLANWMRRAADRIDRSGAPKATSWTFRFEEGRGAVVEFEGHGCRLWYLNDAEYQKAHDPGPRLVEKKMRVGTLKAWVNADGSLYRPT